MSASGPAADGPGTGGGALAARGFWVFSMTVYGRPGVKAACLALQSGGLDVNLGLFVIWMALTGRDPRAILPEAMAQSALWSTQVVKPLRAARDGLKPAPEFADAEAASALRRAVLAAELEAERQQQVFLEALAEDCAPAPDGAPPQALAEAALAAYAERAGRPAAGEFIEAVFSALEIV